MAYVAPASTKPSAVYCKLICAPVPASASANKFFMFSRTATNSMKLYVDGSLLQTLSTVETTPAVPNSPPTTGCRGNSTGTGGDQRAAANDVFYFISAGLSPTQAANMTSDVSTLQTALGRA